VPASAARGFFLTLEGGEGSGKSTLADQLSKRLREIGFHVVLTEEPGGTSLGQEFWRYLRDPASPPLSPLAEVFLFEAARAQHVETVIQPALDAGSVVVCDRFSDSSVAYQGFGRRLGRRLVEELNAIASGGLTPDLTLLLDVPPETGLVRARSLEQGDSAAKRRDAIGAEDLAFHKRVREGFLEIAKEEPGRICVVDATGLQEDVARQAWGVLQGRLERMGQSA